jgi:hypothetical protein
MITPPESHPSPPPVTDSARDTQTLSPDSQENPLKNAPPSSLPTSPIVGVANKIGLALAPALGYFIVFRYEASYCESFGIPRQLIKTDITTVLEFTAVILTLGIAFLPAADAIARLKSTTPGDTPAVRYVRLYAPAVILLIMLLAFLWDDKQQLTDYSVLLGLFILGDIVLATLHPDRKTTPLVYRLRGPLASMHEAFLSPGGANPTIARTASVLFLLLLLSIVPTILGRNHALKKSVFHVPINEANAVLVRTYGERAIFAYYNPSTMKLTGRYFVTSVTNDRTAILEERNLGTLAR